MPTTKAGPEDDAEASGSGREGGRFSFTGSRLSSPRIPGTALLIVAAHPGNETIGAGGLLGHVSSCEILHVTSGAPRDSRFFPESYVGSREDYARIRRDEATRALKLAGFDAASIGALGGIDQEVVVQSTELARALFDVLAHKRPQVVLTHPYEGGHPDQDATALVVHAAVAMLRREGEPAPLVFEMPSFHAGPEGPEYGVFLEGTGDEGVAVALSAEDRARKRRMLDCFASQRTTIAPFLPRIDVERFRPAPPYRFSSPPHPGLLQYERIGWPTKGETWRAHAKETLRALGFDENAYL